MNGNIELLKCIENALGETAKSSSFVSVTSSHFTDYVVEDIDDAKIKQYAKMLNKPTEKEIEAYSRKIEQEKIESQKYTEELEKRGPAFLSDEWRWMQIDVDYKRCKQFVDEYESNNSRK